MRFFGQFLYLLLSVSIVLSQHAGEIRLRVADPSGAPAVVEGTLQGPAQSVSQTFQTDSNGVYTFTGLAAGRYRIDVSRAGFRSQSVAVDLRTGASVSKTLTLALASQATSMNVIAVTPLPGTDLALDQIPSPLQRASAADLENSGALDLSDLMNKRLNGVYINENQGNAYQPDVNYRGYTASPLLGTPEGLSVYMDGVRQNQPFGDIVAWDLIPKIAIQDTTLLPGSDPLYGLNTLGGAVSIQTKDGVSHPGASLTATGGEYGRRAVEAEYGGSAANGLNWYVAGNLYREDGWRRFSPSEVRQAFGKLGWVHGKTSLNMSVGYADNFLTGNGLQDFRFLQQSYSSVYTIPDITWNHSPSVNVSLRHDASKNLTFSGVAYFRYIRADGTNGNLNSNSFDESLYTLSAAEIAALNAAGYKGFATTGSAATVPFPYLRCIAQGLAQNEPVEKCDGVIVNSWTKQNNYGLSGLAAWHNARNHFTAGAAWDRGTTTFQQGVQFAYLNADRVSFTPIAAFADGSSNSNGIPVDERVYLHGRVNTPSVYATDTFTAGKWNFTVSGRYNRSAIQNIDRLPPGFASVSGSDGGRGSLNGNYVFGRFNPAAGFTYAALPSVSVYFSYSESSRAPSSIELGCANPNDPCNLPNALVSDPPLKQVVTRTLEAGVRSSQEGSLRWSAGWFRAENYNDLLFVSSEQTGFGYFANFGQTRRQGVEANLSGKYRHFTLGGGYTFLQATYQSAQSVDGAANSSNQSARAGMPGMDDNIALAAGERIPQTPQHLLKAYADYQPTEKLTLDLDFVAVSRSFARGNENNLDKPDGVYYLGPGSSAGYGVTNLGAHYQVHRRVRLFIQANNLFDHKYYTAAQLAPTPFDNSGHFVGRPFPAVQGNYPIRTSTFYAPGKPLDVFGGMRFTF